MLPAELGASRDMSDIAIDQVNDRTCADCAPLATSFKAAPFSDALSSVKPLLATDPDTATWALFPSSRERTAAPEALTVPFISACVTPSAAATCALNVAVPSTSAPAAVANGATLAIMSLPSPTVFLPKDAFPFSATSG